MVPIGDDAVGEEVETLVTVFALFTYEFSVSVARADTGLVRVPNYLIYVSGYFEVLY